MTGAAASTAAATSRSPACGAKTLDHYIPHWIWPGWDVDNLVLACERCNLAKGAALPWPLVWLLLDAFRPENWELTA